MRNKNQDIVGLILFIILFLVIVSVVVLFSVNNFSFSSSSATLQKNVLEGTTSVKKLYYMDVNFYHYFIGREDQSVNEQVMIGRIDQQIKVNKIMIDIMAEQDFRGKDKHLKKYMYIYLDKIMGVTSALLLVAGTDEALEKKKEVWQYLKKKSFPMYLKLRTTPMGLSLNIPGRPGRKISVRGYKIARKLVGFN